MKNIISYRDVTKLKLYNKAFELSKKIYFLIKDMNEYSLRDQLLRSSTSCFANISEGFSYADIYKAKYLNFLVTAYASHNESKSWVLFFAEIGLLSTDSKADILKDINEINYMFVSLINSVRKEIEYLKASKKASKQSGVSNSIVLDLLEDEVDIAEPNDDYDDFCDQYGF